MSFHYFAGAACRALTGAEGRPIPLRGLRSRIVGPGRAAIRIWPNSTRPRSAIPRCGCCCGAPACPSCATRPGLIGAARGAGPRPRRVPSPTGRRSASPSPTSSTPSRSTIPGRRRRCSTAPRRVAGADRRRDPRLRAASARARYRQNGFLPTYAAFNLIGDPDFRGRELIMALTGLNARGYKNSSLLFNLARVFIARSQAAPWSIRPGEGSPSRCGSRCRSATARPITMHSSSRRC